MNTYVKNYWSLYLDFIHDFQNLKYSGFSLSYLVHFPALIRKNPEIWKALYDESFTNRLTRQVKDQQEFQDVFDKYFQSHRKKSFVKNENRKVVVIADRLIRFPSRTFDDYFKPHKTVLIHTNKNKSIEPAANNIPTKYISDYKPDIKRETIQVKNKARALLKSFKGHHLYKEENFQKVLLTKLEAIINQIEICKKILKDVPASCIVVSSPNHFGRVVALVAAEQGIATICMQHGIIANEFGYIPKIATIDAVYGQYEVDWYRKLGVAKKSLAIIGHPRFDQAFQSQTSNRIDFNKELGLDNRKKTLLVVVRGDRNIGKWKILLDTISKELDLNILVKDFPNTNPHELTKAFPYVHSTQAFDLYDILPNVDCVVSYTSTVGLEAMLMKKPVFILHNTLPSYTGYFDDLGDVVQKDPKKLGGLIVKYYNDPAWSRHVDGKREKFLHYAYPDLGMSGERLSKLVNRLTG
ncbi:hypothetical protein QGM71_12100 [Virgibacillus sp. C22-A2]|uniref:Uncharacterized protein n=1 Tax=Virgibacillus tibetensis TaxID=3042313 RepID=A0ABU6KGL4_9BACI|nr:hypothetical protein [Virgibacillus sp. C22-A2]